MADLNSFGASAAAAPTQKASWQTAHRWSRDHSAATNATSPQPRAATPHRDLRLRHDVEDHAIVGREVGLGNPQHVGRRHIHEDVELTIRRGDVVVNHCRVRQVSRLVLVGLAAHDVVAANWFLARCSSLASTGSLVSLSNASAPAPPPAASARLDDGHCVKQVGILGDVAAAEGCQRDAFLVHQLERILALCPSDMIFAVMCSGRHRDARRRSRRRPPPRAAATTPR